jgi:hypothetical protein
MTTWQEDLEQRAQLVEAAERQQAAVMEPKVTPVEQLREWEFHTAKEREAKALKLVLLALAGITAVIWAVTWFHPLN